MGADRGGGATKQLQRALKPGYKVIAASKHLMIVGPDGKLVRHETGRPFTISKTGYLGDVPRKALRQLQILRLP